MCSENSEILYIKAIIKQVINYNDKIYDEVVPIKVELEGVEKFNLKYKEYKSEFEFFKDKTGDKTQKIKDQNVFISNIEFVLKDADKEFFVSDKLQDLINSIFASGTAYIFEIDPSDTITSVRKCD